MSNRRTLMAAAAIVLALVAGIGVYAYAAGADKRAEDNAAFVDALVATANIAKGTTGAEALQAGLIDKERVAKGSLPPSMVQNMNDVVNKVASGPIDAKQFITTGTFVPADQGAASAFANSISANNYVAVTITVDADRGVANQIAPGDHVDIASKPTDAQGNPIGTGDYVYFMNNVKVLAVGATTIQQQPTAPGGAAPAQPSGVLTFEMTPDQALKLISVNSKGGVYLVLLPPNVSGSGGTGSATKATASGK